MKAKKTKRAAGSAAKKTTRVTVDFPVAQHRKLKAIAALKGISLQEYIRNRVIQETDSDQIADEKLEPIVNKIIDQHADVLKRLSKK